MNTATQNIGALGHGAFLSPLDKRNWTLASAGATTTYPTSCIMDISWMKVSMQGKIGCCVGCTGEEVVRRIVYLMTGIVPEELSWRFVYAVAKCLDGVQDEGTYPQLVAKIIRDYGVPLATFCPNDVSLAHEDFVYGRNLANIPKEAFADALTRRSGAYFTEPVSLDGLKKAITYANENKGGVMILREIGDSYWKDVNGINTWDKAKLLPLRIPAIFSSGHEEFLHGYDEEPGTGRVRIYSLNHWSELWADKGTAWEYADVWLPHIKELIVCVPNVPLIDNFKYDFLKVTTTLQRGMKGADIVALQHVLKLEGCYPASLAFTGYFGDKTFAGVVLLQQKYAQEILVPAGYTKGTGIVGPRTRKWLSTHYQI